MSSSYYSSSSDYSFETKAREEELCKRIFCVNNETDYIIKIGSYRYLKKGEHFIPGDKMNLTLNKTMKYFKLTFCVKCKSNKYSFYIPIEHNTVTIQWIGDTIECNSTYKLHDTYRCGKFMS